MCTSVFWFHMLEKDLLQTSNCFPFSLRAKLKNVWFLCTLLEVKVEWFYMVALMASLLQLCLSPSGYGPEGRRGRTLRELNEILRDPMV